MMIMKHWHHINPKHNGGTDDPSNLIELDIKEHAEAHRVLFEKYGRWQDEFAWLGLSGQIGMENIIVERIKRANTGRSPWNKGKKGSQIAWNKGTVGIMKENKTSFRKGGAAWNIGLPNPQAAENARKSAHKISASRKGKRWFYNPHTKQVTFTLPENMPSGFLPGKKVPAG